MPYICNTCRLYAQQSFTCPRCSRAGLFDFRTGEELQQAGFLPSSNTPARSRSWDDPTPPPQTPTPGQDTPFFGNQPAAGTPQGNEGGDFFGAAASTPVAPPTVQPMTGQAYQGGSQPRRARAGRPRRNRYSRGFLQNLGDVLSRVNFGALLRFLFVAGVVFAVIGGVNWLWNSRDAILSGLLDLLATFLPLIILVWGILYAFRSIFK